MFAQKRSLDGLLNRNIFFPYLALKTVPVTTPITIRHFSEQTIKFTLFLTLYKRELFCLPKYIKYVVI